MQPILRAFLCGAVLLTSDQLVLSQAAYTIVAIEPLQTDPTPTPRTRAFGMNNSGFVVGTSTVNGGYTHAIVFRGGAPQDLGTLPLPPGWTDANSAASAISDVGTIVGNAKVYRPGPMDFVEHGVVTSGGTLQDICGMSQAGDICGDLSYLEAVNNAGVAVGRALSAAFSNYRAIRVSGGQPTDLGSLGGASSEAYGINDEGFIVGASQTTDGSIHAFRLRPNSSLSASADLGTLGGNISYAYAIKGSNVVGSSSTAGGYFLGFFWRDLNKNGAVDSAEMVGISPPPGYSDSSAKAINAFSRVVGDSTDADGNPRAIIWDECAGSRDLTAILGDPNWILEEAVAINDQGQIAGNGKHNGARRAFLLTPVVNYNFVTAEQLYWYLVCHAARGRATLNAEFADLGNLQALIEESVAEGWDPRFILAIAGRETTFGRAGFPEALAHHNFWGVNCEPNHGERCTQYPNFRVAVRGVATHIKKAQYLGGSSLDVIGYIYPGAAGSAPWIDTVKEVMQCLGYSNPCDVTCVGGEQHPFGPGDGCPEKFIIPKRIGDRLLLSWPPGLNVVLESSDHPDSTAWTVVTSGSGNSITVDLDQSERYFRLRQP